MLKDIVYMAALGLVAWGAIALLLGLLSYLHDRRKAIRFDLEKLEEMKNELEEGLRIIDKVQASRGGDFDPAKFGRPHFH